MGHSKIQEIWERSYPAYQASGRPMSAEQKKASAAILNCKTGRLGYNVSQCSECGYTAIHNNSCRNRNCPNCQAVNREVWIDKRRAEVIDAPYFHIVFTLPHDLNDLMYCNQKAVYGLLHRCCARTILQLSSDEKYLGAEPGIIQVLHTWNQELNYHVHMHCIVSGAGLTRDRKLVHGPKRNFFIPVHVLRDMFKGKFLAELNQLYENGELVFSNSCSDLKDPESWQCFRNSLYQKDWCPYIKETFNGFGNAIEYLGRYTNKIAISNSRILSVTEDSVTFSARGKKSGDPKRAITISGEEFIRRYLMHVLPTGFQKIRYYGFLNNRCKNENLRLIFSLQNRERFLRRYAGMSTSDLLLAIWNVDVCRCPNCGGNHMRSIGRVFSSA